MDPLQTAINGGAFALLAFLVFHYVTKIEPERIKQVREQSAKEQQAFLAALEQKRADDLAAIERIQADNRAARAEERSDFLAAMLQQRNDFLARDEARDVSHGRHLEAQRTFFEHQSELERTACTAQMESIAQSVRNLAEIIVMQNAEERRRPDFGVKPKPEGGGR